jgi:hypothetical protein
MTKNLLSETQHETLDAALKTYVARSNAAGVRTQDALSGLLSVIAEFERPLRGGGALRWDGTEATRFEVRLVQKHGISAEDAQLLYGALYNNDPFPASLLSIYEQYSWMTEQPGWTNRPEWRTYAGD